jgi:hypothetical protein
MISAIRSRLKPTPVGSAWGYIKSAFGHSEINEWKKLGRPVPPPDAFKQQTVRKYAKRFAIGTLIETGTAYGDMVYALKDVFTEIYSIELGDALYQRARERFAVLPHVHIFHGDSATILPQLLASIDKPCLFWLDGHYSGGSTAKGDIETPIKAELRHISNHHREDHVILIDDARMFTGDNDYPTIEELKKIALAEIPGSTFDVADDIIRIHKQIDSRPIGS